MSLEKLKRNILRDSRAQLLTLFRKRQDDLAVVFSGRNSGIRSGVWIFPVHFSKSIKIGGPTAQLTLRHASEIIKGLTRMEVEDLSPKLKRRMKKNSGQEKINFSLKNIQPLTYNQKVTFREYSNDKNLMLHGFAGTGKTFLLLYLALNQVLNENSPYKKVIIVRSVVPTRDVGFLPGSPKEKVKVYEAPYYAILTELFGRGDAYEYLKTKGIIEFMTTSFIRGITINDAIVIVDEMQNASLHELDSCITRIGHNCKIHFSGDFRQSDFTRYGEREGVINFMRIIKAMEHNNFSFVEFQKNDIVRSDTVKDYIVAKEQLGIAV
jgi:phosphate starvation-inducible PhoH-like protein